MDRARSLADIGAVPKKEFEQASADQQGAQQGIKSQESVIGGILARLHRFGISESDLQGPPVTTITSPFAGVVTKQEASPGEVIESTSALFTIADLTTVWVQAEVYEKDLGRLRIGQPAFITVDTYPNQQFTGKVTYVSDFLDPRTYLRAQFKKWEIRPSFSFARQPLNSNHGGCRRGILSAVWWKSSMG